MNSTEVSIHNRIPPVSDDKFILMDENYNDNKGYIIEHYGNKMIHVTFWVFQGHGQGQGEDEEELIKKRCVYNSLKNLYEESQKIVKSDLINHSLLHQSQYRMMCDYITYYENSRQFINF